MKKRILAILLAAVMVAGLLPMAAMAVGTTTITVEADKATVDQDDVITFTVSVQSTDKIGTIQLYPVIPEGLTYVDNSATKLDGVEAAVGATENGDIVYFQNSDLQLGMTVGSENGMTLANKVAVATFQCKAEKGGTYSVSMEKGELGTVTDVVYNEVTPTINAASVTVNKTRQTLGTLALAYDNATIAIDGTHLTGAATATVTAKDDEGDDMAISKVTNLTFVTDPATVAGVTVADNGNITVDKTVTAGTFTVKAKAGSVESDPVTITVTKEASVATTVVSADANETTALIPTDVDSKDYTYAVDVLDQYGAKMTGETVTWAAGTLPTGVTFDAATAKLTVAKTAESGEVTLTATVGGKSLEIKVNVTNISFTGVADGVKATDGVYGDKLSDMVKIDASKITATAGAAVPGTYTLKDADTVPAAADAVAYEVVFNSTEMKDGKPVYENIPVASGTVKVAKKEVTVTATDVTVKVGSDLDPEEFGYTVSEMVGEDELEGTATYKFFAMDEDGNKTETEVTTIDTDEVAEYAIVVGGLTASENYDVKFVDGVLTVRKKNLAIGTGTKPTEPNKPDDEKLAFDDVKEGDWFYDAVNYVAENKLMTGTADKIFEPNTNTSRAMIATILWRQSGSPEPVARIADFPDVDADAWYIKAVRWCAEKEIVTGYENGNFGPNDLITREQMAAMFYRYAGSPEVDAAMGMAGFTDVDAISEWAATAMRWAVQNGILNGKDGGMLDPQGLATRAETAAVLQRYLSKK